MAAILICGRPEPRNIVPKNPVSAFMYGPWLRGIVMGPGLRSIGARRNGELAY